MEYQNLVNLNLLEIEVHESLRHRVQYAGK